MARRLKKLREPKIPSIRKGSLVRVPGDETLGRVTRSAHRLCYVVWEDRDGEHMHRKRYLEKVDGRTL